MGCRLFYILFIPLVSTVHHRILQRIMSTLSTEHCILFLYLIPLVSTCQHFQRTSITLHFTVPNEDVNTLLSWEVREDQIEFEDRILTQENSDYHSFAHNLITGSQWCWMICPLQVPNLEQDHNISRSIDVVDQFVMPEALVGQETMALALMHCWESWLLIIFQVKKNVFHSAWYGSNLPECFFSGLEKF